MSIFPDRLDSGQARPHKLVSPASSFPRKLGHGSTVGVSTTPCRKSIPGSRPNPGGTDASAGRVR